MRLSGRPRMFVPETGCKHTAPITVQSVDVLWWKQRHLAPAVCYGSGPCESEEKQDFTWQRKRKLADQFGEFSKKKINWRGFTKTGISLHPKTRIRHDDELGCRKRSQIPGKEVDKTRGWGFCARQSLVHNSPAGVRTHLRWRRSQTYCNTSLIHRLLGIHVKSLSSSSF